jgi:UDP-N-acetylglucosamine transferase subunit ALG13
MILATMGTHPAAMDRLVKALDNLAATGEDVGIQMAQFNTVPQLARVIPLMSPEDYKKQLLAAQDIICHGAAATILSIFKIAGKVPLVVPRQHRFREHVDDHQVYFAKYVNHHYGIPYVMDMKDLPACLAKTRSLRLTLELPDSLNELCDHLDHYMHTLHPKKGRS